MRIAVAEGTITADDLLADWLVVTETARLTIDASLAGPLVWRLGAGAYRRYRDVYFAMKPIFESAARAGARG